MICSKARRRILPLRLLFIATTVWAQTSCTSRYAVGGTHEPARTNTTAIQIGGPPVASSEKILSEVKNIGAVVVTVQSDPVYGGIHQYRAVPLAKVLKCLDTNGIERSKGNEIVFSCEDGYQSVLHARSANLDWAFLAISDANGTPSQEWKPAHNGAGAFTPGPLYLVWTNQTAEVLPWPYQITEIKIRPDGLSLRRAEPSSAPQAQLGFALFCKNCISCHSINGAGGKVGVDLNSPLNVTEYWRVSAIKKLIANPDSIRKNSKMPGFPQLSGQDVGALVAYLRDMRNRKDSAD